MFEHEFKVKIRAQLPIFDHIMELALVDFLFVYGIKEIEVEAIVDAVEVTDE